METIGEGEEEENLPTVTNCTRANSLESDNAVSQDFSEPIRALRLCTRLSFSEGQSPSEDPSSDGAGTRPPGRSFSHMPAERASSPLTTAPGRSFPQSHMRRPSTLGPESDRGPGNPLFPSNFGRLSIGPTLAANNPALRRQSAPLPSAYLALRRYTHADAEPSRHLPVEPLNRRPLSGSDYAISLGSVSSDKSSVSGDLGQSYR